MPLPKMPDVSGDEIRDLVAKGWTPPPHVAEQYRHLLRPFYDARGWKSLPGRVLDTDDCAMVAALIATFDHFGVPLPDAPPSPVIVPAGVEVFRG